RQTFLNGLIPSEQRATVLSFDNLLGSSGGVVIQPALGKVADAASYATSYVVGAGVALAALPFMLLARQTRASSDPVEAEPAQPGG
ncbi:MAG TPA: MFS transporter, partial [Actinomycetes bacterium]